VGLPGRRSSSFSGAGAPPSAAPGSSSAARQVEASEACAARRVEASEVCTTRRVEASEASAVQRSGGERGGGELGFERGRDARTAKCGGEMRR
jgi:hypothetical protein